MNEYRIEAVRWVEGYEHHFYNITANTEAEAEHLINNNMVEPWDGYIDVENGDEIIFNYAEENINEGV